MKISFVNIFLFLLIISFFPFYLLGTNLRFIHLTIILIPLIQIIFRSKICFSRENSLLIFYPISIFVSSFVGGALLYNVFFILDNVAWSFFSSIRFKFILTPKKCLKYFSYTIYLLVALNILILAYHLIFFGRYFALKEINGVRIFFGLCPLLICIKINLRKYIYKINSIFSSDFLMLIISLIILVFSFERKSIYGFLLSSLFLFIVKINLRELNFNRLKLVKKRFENFSKFLIIFLFLITFVILFFSDSLISIISQIISSAVKPSNISRLSQLVILLEYLKENWLFGSPSLHFNELMVEKGYTDVIASNIHGYYQRLIFAYGVIPMLLSFLPIFLAIKTIFKEKNYEIFYIKSLVIYPIIVFVLFCNLFFGGGSLSNILNYLPLIVSNLNLISDSKNSLRYS